MSFDATTRRMDTMNRRTLVIGATLCLTLLMPVWLRAEIPEPDHVFWGKASYFGDDVTEGEVTITVNDEPEVLARYEVGSRPELGPQFVLRIPLDSTGPRVPGSARPGDLALTEFMKDPTAVSDSHGEWIELFFLSRFETDLKYS